MSFGTPGSGTITGSDGAMPLSSLLFFSHALRLPQFSTNSWMATIFGSVSRILPWRHSSSGCLRNSRTKSPQRSSETRLLPRTRGNAERSSLNLSGSVRKTVAEQPIITLRKISTGILSSFPNTLDLASASLDRASGGYGERSEPDPAAPASLAAAPPLFCSRQPQSNGPVGFRTLLARR